MFRHYDVSAYVGSVPASHLLQGPHEDVARLRRAEKRRALIATECEVMQTARFLKTL